MSIITMGATSSTSSAQELYQESISVRISNPESSFASNVSEQLSRVLPGSIEVLVLTLEKTHILPQDVCRESGTKCICAGFT